MHNIKKLHVYTLARENLRAIYKLRGLGAGFGDLTDQIQRAAISVVSNIAEGAGSGSDKQFRRFLTYAKASNTEIQSQLDIMCDLGSLTNQHEIHDSVDRLGAMLEKLIRRFSG